MATKKNTINVDGIIKALRVLKEEIDAFQEEPKIRVEYSNDPCKYCATNPKNGGSGICLCTLGIPKITC